MISTSARLASLAGRIHVRRTILPRKTFNIPLMVAPFRRRRQPINPRNSAVLSPALPELLPPMPLGQTNPQLADKQKWTRTAAGVSRVEGTANATGPAVQDVRVDHGRLQRFEKPGQRQPPLCAAAGFWQDATSSALARADPSPLCLSLSGTAPSNCIWLPLPDPRSAMPGRRC